MINRYSSRRGSLSESLLNKKLKNAKSYDRIAGYFRSSIFEISGEELDSVKGKIRVICNSDINEEDLSTAKQAEASIRGKWCEKNPEKITVPKKRLVKLYNALKRGKLEIRVLPDKRFGLIHGKAGVITLENGEKTSFLGSVNESKTAWKYNYELVWEDTSKEAIDWVQEEFDSLWSDPLATPISEFVIEDIKRVANRKEYNINDWRNEEENQPPATIIEAPIYRKHLGLWDHQKYFINKAFKDHKTNYGARYVLADQVGLGKTVQLAVVAQLTALYGIKPVLIIVPKTLIPQWQEELNDLLDIPSAIWDGKNWIDENNIKYPNGGKKDIVKCPRKIGIISQGLITAKSKVCDSLLNKEYECVIVDEAHRARRSNLGPNTAGYKPKMNNLYSYLMKLSKKTHSLLLATATPMQMYPVELWDLLNILSQKNDSVLGSKTSNWKRKNTRQESLDIVTGKEKLKDLDVISWDWMRNPFPPANEREVKFKMLRNRFGMKDNEFVARKSLVDFDNAQLSLAKTLISNNFFNNFNPYIRHIIRRERKYLEEKINPTTNEPYLKKINVNLHGEGEEEALELTGYMKEAYQLAEDFCKLLKERTSQTAFIRTLLLRRIGSSMISGLNTGNKLVNDWNTDSDLLYEEDFEATKLRNLTHEETLLLEKFIKTLNSNHATDPKYLKIIELLKEEKWMKKGVIIFSQYFDSAFWIAKNLSKEFVNKPIALYAGGDKSGVFINEEFEKKTKEEIKKGVKDYKYKILVGTDSAAEGLNLQTLGNLINLDLPWNPTKLEQRKGRIQRIGQINDTINIYNLRYKDSVEDRVHQLLSSRLKNITDVFGQLPDVLEDAWVEVAHGEEEKARKIIDNIPNKHPFEKRYNQEVSSESWETCSKVLNATEKRKYMKNSW